MTNAQSGILAEETKLARYLSFSLINASAAHDALIALRSIVDPQRAVIGLGKALTDALGCDIPGHRTMPAHSNSGIDVPSTPDALWVWLRGNDRGEIYHRSRTIEIALSPAFDMVSAVDSFQFDENRDLSGYEDGTENPEGEDAVNAAILRSDTSGLDGSSFVAVQQWLHDFEALDAMSTESKDDAIGRHIADNEEYDAPASAHVKRSAQEDFDPEAFMLRRSMPWVDGMSGGLMFVAFGHSFDAFEAIMNRMIGLDDGIADALFKFTRPLTGAYYWCPPIKDGKLDLGALGSAFAN